MNTKASEPLAPLIASRLVQVLKDRKIEVGSHLPERIFCEALEVSRTPVRRAFELLAKQGILTNEPGAVTFSYRPPLSLWTTRGNRRRTSTSCISNLPKSFWPARWARSSASARY